MSDIDNGGPAFPEAGLSGLPNGDFIHPQAGMSLRDYAALKILQGFCANPAVFAPNGMSGWGLVNCDEEKLTNYAIFIADGYLKARKS